MKKGGNGMKKRLLGYLAIAALTLSACSTTGKNETTTSTDSSSKQVINVSTPGELSTLDSGQYSDVNSSDMIGQVTEGLYRTDKNGDPELAIAAEKPTVSEDGLTYTFKLRDAKWSNGDDVTAADFVYAYQYVVDPTNASSSSNRMDIFKNASKIRQGEADVDTLGVTAVDDHTLQIVLESPITYLDQILVGTPFMPKDVNFAKEKGKDYGTSSENFVGNGPFKIEGWTGANESWKLVKNDSYWDAGNVQLEEIDVQVVKETGTGVNLFETDALDYTTLTDTYAQQYKGNDLAHYVPKALVGYISANQKRDVTGNLNVRQAILQAIDKKSFAEDILGDGSTALNGFVPSNFAKDPSTGEDFRKENGDLLPYNLEKAQASWAKAKEELGKDQITLELLSSDTASSKKTVEYIQGQLEQNLPGLTITIKSVPLQNRLDLQSAGDFDLVFGTWTPDYADPINFLEFYDSKGGLNTSGYASSSYDQGLEEARTTLANDADARWKELLALEKQLIETDTAVLPLYQGAVAYLQSEKLQNLQIFPFGRTVSYRLAYVK
jgi:oligopeptide transport system substrate-binding protein